MKLSKKIAILATALISFAFISCDTDTDDSKPPAESSGSTEAGGSAGTGGSTSSGGSTEAGGSGGTGGSAGGSTESGGSGETGGSTGSGGAGETGGSTGAGGSSEAGGSGGTGGSTESGGSGETGGSTGPGGAGETGGSTEPGGSTGSGGESEGNPVLPGKKGGTGNEKDTFAGKTFYDSVEKDTAEYYTKYVFSTDGTVEIYNKNDDSAGTSADAVINYSFSEDGKIVYMTYNKISDMTPGSGKLYTYEEFVQYINTGYAENFLKLINAEVEEEEEEDALAIKEGIAKQLGLESYTTDEALVDAAKQKMQGLARKLFGAVFQHDLSNDAAGAAVLTERNIWGKDLSKFISLNGDTRYKQYNSDKDFDFSFECVMGSFYCRYVDSTKKPWHYRNVDSAKIYFEFAGANIEAPYTISNDGKRLSTIIEGEVKNYIDAELELGKMSLYN